MRGPARRPGQRATMTEQSHANLRTYELRVRGSLGPLLLSAIPHAAVARVPEHSLLMVRAGSDDKDLVEIVRQMVALGVEIQSVRGTTR